MAGVEDTKNTRSKIHAPHSDRNPIPTIQHYKEEKQQRRDNALPNDDDADSEPEPSRTKQSVDVYKDWKEARHENKRAHDTVDGSANGANQAEDAEGENDNSEDDDGRGGVGNEHTAEDTSQVQGGAAQDPHRRRKSMKKRGDERAEREVTDPVTHLPVKIHDFTSKDLKDTPKNDPSPSADHRSASERNAASRSSDDRQHETADEKEIHAGMQSLFPPPEFDVVRRDIARVYRTALTAGLGAVLLVSVLLLLLEKVFEISSRIESVILRRDSSGKSLSSIFLLLLGTLLGSTVIWVLAGWTDNKVHRVWESHVWDSERQQGKRMENEQAPETVQWLNSLFGNIWPIVNPDLFTSLADTLEDVMQASLPRLVRMISVEDIGQGSEALRILGVKWLPAGAAAKNVTEDGKVKSDKGKNNDRSVGGQGAVDRSSSSGINV